MPALRAPAPAALACAAALGLLGAPGLAACPASPEDLARDAAAAVDAFGQLDVPAFEAARDAVREEVGCLSAPPAPAQAAAVHLVSALDAFGRRDKPAGLSAFAAMRVTGGGAPPASVAPPGGPVDAWWQESAAEPTSGATAVVLPKGYALVVDGALSPTRPTGRPSVQAIVGPDGSVWWSGLMAAGDAPPTPHVEPAGAIADGGEDSGGHRAALPVFISAGGTAAVAGGLWAATLSGRRDINAIAAGIEDNQSEEDLGWTYDEASARYDSTRGLGYAAQAVTGLAVGLVATGVVLAW